MRDPKASKELNLREFKDYEINLNPKKKEQESAPANLKDDIHYISDGRPQSLQRSKSPNIMEEMLLKTVKLYLIFSNVYMNHTNLLLKAARTNLMMAPELRSFYQMN